MLKSNRSFEVIRALLFFQYILVLVHWECYLPLYMALAEEDYLMQSQFSLLIGTNFAVNSGKCGQSILLLCNLHAMIILLILGLTNFYSLKKCLSYCCTA